MDQIHLIENGPIVKWYNVNFYKHSLYIFVFMKLINLLIMYAGIIYVEMMP
jgi:hypothetical protein